MLDEYFKMTTDVVVEHQDSGRAVCSNVTRQNDFNVRYNRVYKADPYPCQNILNAEGTGGSSRPGDIADSHF